MRRLLSVLATLLAGAAGLTLAGVSDAHAGTVRNLRIMPLGDSITWGTGSSTTSSYRADLWNRVTAAGYALDFARIAAFNQQIPAVVAQRANAGAHVRFVDMSAVTTADLSDTLHPDDAGYRKMADAFLDGLQAVIGAGLVTEPAPPDAGCVTGAIRGEQSGRCLDVHGGSPDNGTLVGLWDCTEGVPQQQWTTTANREVRVYGGKCLDASGGGTADGTPVLIWDCTGAPNQQSGAALDSASATTNGAPLIQWGWNGGSQQRWTLR